MKNLILSISLFCIGQFNAQCVKLYVKEHLSGSQICLLGEGDIIEICEDFNEVHGCPREFYIYNKGFSSGSLTYELSLDKGWATHYMTLMVNPTTKRFGFILQGQSATYSYYTESEMESIQARQLENDRIMNQKRAEQAKINDEKTKLDINSALQQKEYFKALQLFNLLNYKDDNLLIKINEGWLPEKERYNKIYQEYIAQFKLVEKEYFTSEKDFLLKYPANIKSKELVINGKEAYLKRIESTSDRAIKIYREQRLKTDSYFYLKNENKHLICPVGIEGNYYMARYNQQNVNKLNISLKYDTVANTYFSIIEFCKDEKILLNAPIVSTNVFLTKYFLMPLPIELNSLYLKIINESGRQMLESLYPQQIIHMNSSEPISIASLSNIPYPEDGKRNVKYDDLQKEFEIVKKDVEKLSSRIEMIPNENFYNPSILYLVKKLYPDADTLVLAFGDYRESMGNLGLHIKFDISLNWERLNSQIDKGASLIPLTKGVVELKNNKLIVYDTMGNYKEFEAYRILPASKIALTTLETEKLKLDSAFLKTYDSYSGYVNQFPIIYKQIEVRPKNKEVDFKVNDSLVIGLLPAYIIQDLDFPSIGKPLFDPMNTLILKFNIGWKNGYRGTDGFGYSTYVNIQSKQVKLEAKLDEYAKKYFQEMTNYFTYQNESKAEKAIKSLTKANQYLDSFKQIYFNSIFDPKI